MIFDLHGDSVMPFSIYGNEANEAYNISGEIVYPDSPVRTLVFEDDFDSFNSENWGFEIGNVRNNELQFYRSFNNISFENSNLVITAKRENYLGSSWTSASLTGQQKKSWQYGRFEARIKFPKINGAFPAFWTLGANHIIAYADEETGEMSGQTSGVRWPMCGEIDISEHYPGGGDRITSGAICNINGGTSPTNVGRVYVTDFEMGEYHIYALEWTSEKLEYFVDGELILSHDNPSYTDAFRLPQYILLNLAVGASGGTPDANTNEMKMYVDWVRVYAPLT